MIASLRGGLNRVVSVNHPDTAVAEQGRLLLILMLLPAMLNATYLLFALFLDPGHISAALVVLIIAEVPTFVLAKKGLPTIAVVYYVLMFTLTVCWLAYYTTQINDDTNVLAGLIYALLINIVLVAGTLQPVALIWVTGLNIVAIVFMFRTWSVHNPALQQINDILTSLIYPVLLQTLLAAVCFVVMTHLRNIMRAQDRQLKLLKAILENIPVGVAVFDGDRVQPTYNNDLIVKWTGPLRKELRVGFTRTILSLEENDMGTAWATEIGQTQQELPWEIVRRTRSSYNPAGDIAIDSPAGTVTVREKSVPVTDSDGSLLYVVYSAMDVTSYHEMNAKLVSYAANLSKTNQNLRELDQLKSEFVASISHELRTPLNTIIGRTDVLLSDRINPPTPQLAADLRAILTAGDDLLRLINDLLDLAKIEANQIVLNTCDTDLVELLRSVAQVALVLANRKQLALECDLPTSPVRAPVDSQRIRQVVYNLLSNAIKYTDQGEVRLILSATDQDAVISVRDTGPGIPKNQQETIFNRFVRRDDMVTTPRNGSGLGLTIARSFVALHGGTLRVDSTPGKGATFSFNLPLHGPPSPEPAAPVMEGQSNGDAVVPVPFSKV